MCVIVAGLTSGSVQVISSAKVVHSRVGNCGCRASNIASRIWLVTTLVCVPWTNTFRNDLVRDAGSIYSRKGTCRFQEKEQELVNLWRSS